jgi:hypothetical protein
MDQLITTLMMQIVIGCIVFAIYRHVWPSVYGEWKAKTSTPQMSMTEYMDELLDRLVEPEAVDLTLGIAFERLDEWSMVINELTPNTSTEVWRSNWYPTIEQCIKQYLLLTEEKTT